MIKVFKALACENRIKILKLLFSGEMCICDFSKYINLDIGTISRHIKALNEAGLVKVEKRGNRKYVKIKNKKVISLLKTAEELFSKQK